MANICSGQGGIVYSQQHRYLCARIELDEARLLSLDPRADLDAVRGRG